MKVPAAPQSANFRDHRVYMVHLLRVLAKAGRANPGDIYEEVADRAGITPEERAIESTGALAQDTSDDANVP